MHSIKQLINVGSNIVQSAQLYLNQALKEKNLSSAETNVLMFLYTNGDHVSQDAIVSGVDVSKPAISRTINSLEKKGYIVREPNPNDKRSNLINLTEKAWQEEEYIQSVYADFLNIAARGLPEDKVAEFIGLLQQVSDNIDSYRRAEMEKK
ncbi:MAG TPA: MarR family transcriptional regulator [Firmicutes bacterium]|jgi:DNA-binding MarR family transcriptional regulator|nr:MarR family transcriptional regulator [Bacillota bacterium]